MVTFTPFMGRMGKRKSFNNKRLRRKHSQHNVAFALVELPVIIAVVGMLIAIFLSVV